jgi:hypothetical protein
MDSRAHPGSNVTGVYEKLYVAQSLKVMAQAVPGLRGGNGAGMITDFSPTGDGRAGIYSPSSWFERFRNASARPFQTMATALPLLIEEATAYFSIGSPRRRVFTQPRSKPEPSLALARLLPPGAEFGRVCFSPTKPGFCPSSRSLHERFGANLMAYSQWAPEHARKCADAAG